MSTQSLWHGLIHHRKGSGMLAVLFGFWRQHIYSHVGCCSDPSIKQCRRWPALNEALTRKGFCSHLGLEYKYHCCLGHGVKKTCGIRGAYGRRRCRVLHTPVGESQCTHLSSGASRDMHSRELYTIQRKKKKKLRKLITLTSRIRRIRPLWQPHWTSTSPLHKPAFLTPHRCPWEDSQEPSCTQISVPESASWKPNWRYLHLVFIEDT